MCTSEKEVEIREGEVTPVPAHSLCGGHTWKGPELRELSQGDNSVQPVLHCCMMLPSLDAKRFHSALLDPCSAVLE